MKTKNSNPLPVIHNRKATHEYHVIDTYEVGIMLKGTEVKSIRAGKMELAEAYVIVRNNELFLINSYVDEYSHGSNSNHVQRQERKLLAKKKEIQMMKESSDVKGHTIIPLKGYFKGERFKLEIGICKGKDHRDKRQDKAKQEAKREMDRELKEKNYEKI